MNQIFPVCWHHRLLEQIIWVLIPFLLFSLILCLRVQSIIQEHLFLLEGNFWKSFRSFEHSFLRFKSIPFLYRLLSKIQIVDWTYFRNILKNQFCLLHRLSMNWNFKFCEVYVASQYLEYKLVLESFGFSCKILGKHRWISLMHILCIQASSYQVYYFQFLDMTIEETECSQNLTFVISWIFIFSYWTHREVVYFIHFMIAMTPHYSSIYMVSNLCFLLDQKNR